MPSCFNHVWLFHDPIDSHPGSSVQQEYWIGLPFPFPGDLSDPGIELMSLMFLALAGGFFITSTTWEALESPYDTAIQLLGIYTEKKNENPTSKRCIYINIHSSTIYNRQDMEVTCVHQQINKVRIYIYMCVYIYIYTHILFITTKPRIYRRTVQKRC